MMDSGKIALASLHGVHKHYGKVRALDGVELTLHAGQVLALLGPNGAGKTTTIGLLLGLLRADQGKVRLFGHDPQQLAARRRIGVMLQHAELPPSLRVGELIGLTASYYPAPRSVLESAAMAGVEDLLARPYGKLSGGQQRRVQFALAVCGNPELLFLDEPTVGMDIHARQRLWDTIRSLVAGGTAVVLTTHYLEEAEQLADRVCVMLGGCIVSDGSVAALRARVATRHVRCVTTLSANEVAHWPGVREARRENDRLWLSCDPVEAVVRRLLDADPALSGLEVQPAGLGEAFCELTRESVAPTLHEAA